jgi:hypothetical protein
MATGRKDEKRLADAIGGSDFKLRHYRKPAFLDFATSGD